MITVKEKYTFRNYPNVTEKNFEFKFETIDEAREYMRSIYTMFDKMYMDTENFEYGVSNIFNVSLEKAHEYAWEDYDLYDNSIIPIDSDDIVSFYIDASLDFGFAIEVEIENGVME